jgi:hypothetical protein
MIYYVVRAKVAPICGSPGERPAAWSNSFGQFAHTAARHRRALKWGMSMRLLEKRLVLALAVVVGCGGGGTSGSPRPDARKRLALTQFPRGKGSQI